VNPLRSVGARLSLALAILVAAALGLVYAVVVPSLERNLVQAKVSQLRRAAPVVRREFSPYDLDFFAQSTAQTTSARVVVYLPLAFNTLSPQADTGPDSSEVEDDPLALAASQTGRIRSGTVQRGETRFAEAAIPTRDGYVILLTSPLRDALRNVHLVQRRLVEAGILALLVSIAVGYGAAWMFARRIRRLERAADRIAGGSFEQPVVDHGADELGELARAFERMRGRLAQLDHARREFIANASHELRTPLFSLGGFLELLTDEELDEETRREFLATMREQVERLTKLATELLDLSRLDAGRIRVERERVDLEPLAAALAEEFRAVAQARGHELELDAEPATGLGDSGRVHQIGSVLLENALVHTPPGTTVRIRARRCGEGVELAVEDDGPGIPVEHAQQVFERFYRIEGAIASGSGLGLAIARELAALMDGRLELESSPGRTVFRLLLRPAVEAPEPELAAAV
jgi:two-component system OmpR family sensor kinase